MCIENLANNDKHVVQVGLCDNDKTYISITPPKFISLNDIISIIFLNTKLMIDDQ